MNSHAPASQDPKAALESPNASVVPAQLRVKSCFAQTQGSFAPGRHPLQRFSDRFGSKRLHKNSASRRENRMREGELIRPAKCGLLSG
jgi:hypothetical protein